MASVTVSTRLAEEEAQGLAELARDMGMERGPLLRHLLRRGYADVRLEQALQLYRDRKVTLSRAAEMAGMHYRDLLAALPDASVELNYDLVELRRDLEAA